MVSTPSPGSSFPGTADKGNASESTQRTQDGAEKSPSTGDDSRVTAPQEQSEGSANTDLEGFLGDARLVETCYNCQEFNRSYLLRKIITDDGHLDPDAIEKHCPHCHAGLEKHYSGISEQELHDHPALQHWGGPDDGVEGGDYPDLAELKQAQIGDTVTVTYDSVQGLADDQHATGTIRELLRGVAERRYAATAIVDTGDRELTIRLYTNDRARTPDDTEELVGHGDVASSDQKIGDLLELDVEGVTA